MSAAGGSDSFRVRWHESHNAAAGVQGGPGSTRRYTERAFFATPTVAPAPPATPLSAPALKSPASMAPTSTGRLSLSRKRRGGAMSAATVAADAPAPILLDDDAVEEFSQTQRPHSAPAALAPLREEAVALAPELPEPLRPAKAARQALLQSIRQRTSAGSEGPPPVAGPSLPPPLLPPPSAAAPVAPCRYCQQPLPQLPWGVGSAATQARVVRRVAP